MSIEFQNSKLEIDVDPSGHGTIKLDGVDLSNAVYAFEIKGSVGDATRVRLDLVAQKVTGNVFDPEVFGLDEHTHRCTKCTWTGDAPPQIAVDGCHLNPEGGTCDGLIGVHNTPKELDVAR